MTTDRWPLQPLLDATNQTPYGLARVTGVSQAMIRDAVTSGLSDNLADKIAIRLGWHPAMIWPEWADAGLSPLDEVFLNGGWRQAWLWNEKKKAA